jgi:hypothetical protein
MEPVVLRKKKLLPHFTHFEDCPLHWVSYPSQAQWRTGQAVHIAYLYTQHNGKQWTCSIDIFEE